jgi:hypothetical protein
VSDPKDRELEDAIRNLPRSLDPERDLWTQIAARIEAKRRPTALLGRGLGPTKAAVLGMVATLSIAAAVAFVLKRRDAARSVAMDETPPAAAPSAAPPHIDRSEAGQQVYILALRQLEASFAEQRRLLPSDAVHSIEASLAVLDEAIGATTKALEAAPGSPELEGQLRDEYEQKIRALTDIIDLTTGAS